jgi:hypothetical protein
MLWSISNNAVKQKEKQMYLKNAWVSSVRVL